MADSSSCMDGSTLKDCLQSVVIVPLDGRLLKMDSSLVTNKTERIQANPNVQLGSVLHGSGFRPAVVQVIQNSSFDCNFYNISELL